MRSQAASEIPIVLIDSEQPRPQKELCHQFVPMNRHPRLQVFARSCKEFIDSFRVNFPRVICLEMKQKTRVGAEGRLTILGGGRACKRAPEHNKPAKNKGDAGQAFAVELKADAHLAATGKNG